MVWNTLFSVLGGVIVGALLNELGVWFKGYREDKRVLKMLLFNQLELWIEIKRTDIGELAPKLLKVLRTALIIKNVDEKQVSSLTDNALPGVIAMLKSMKLGDPAAIVPRYQASILKVAEVDPVFAYRLSGRGDDRFQKAINDFADNAQKSLNSTVPEGFVDNSITALVDHDLRRTLSQLEKEIIGTSKRIGWRTKRSVGKAIERLDFETDPRLAIEVNNCIEALVQSYASRVQAQG